MCPPAQAYREISTAKIRCALVHDHVLLRQGLRRLLEDEPDLEVVSESGAATECITKIFDLRPDVVIADANAFGLSPFEVQLLFARECLGVKLILLSVHARCGTEHDHPGYGLTPSVARHASVEELVDMVRSVCVDISVAEAEGSRTLKSRRDATESSTTRHQTLTAREREILKLLAEGKTVRAAANTLGLSSKTVDAHKFNLMRKLGIHNKAELVMWAIQERVVRVPVPF